jgi:hypothetical protein
MKDQGMLRTLLGIIFFSIFVTPVYALEVTNYNFGSGKFHAVTVALDDLSATSKVRCVIRKSGKPVGMAEQAIRGVGTITKVIGSSPTETTAECSIVK